MMHFQNSPLSFRALPLGLALAMTTAACGEDDGSGDAATGLTVSTTMAPTSETGDATATDTDASTTDPSTTGTTDPSTTGTTGTTDPSTTGTTDPSTTGTTDPSTTGTSTSGTTGGGDCNEDPGWGAFEMGAQVKHITGSNHDGSPWNMGDWCGTKIGLDVSAVWCQPCTMVSACLAGDDGQCGQIFGGSYGADLRAAIENDSIKWVTFLTQNAGGQPSAVSDAAAWDMQYHNAKIPVVIPDEHAMVEAFAPEFVPAIHALDEGMRFAAIDDGQTWNQLDFLIQ